MNWRPVDLSDSTALASARERSEAILASDPRRHIFHTLDWQLASTGRGPEAVKPFFLEAADGTVGYTPFAVQPWRLRFRLGEITVFARALERLHLMGGPLIAPPQPQQDETESVTGLLRAVHGALASNQVVFLEGVPETSSLGRLLTDRAARRSLPFHTLAYGAPFPRHLIQLPASLDEYMARLGRRTREGLRRKRRKLRAQAAGGLVLERISKASEIPAFVDAAVSVSRKTYQWHLLGLGLRDPEHLIRILEAMAAKERTRCYLLRVGEAPVAFMIGYQYRTTYHYIDVGFDPDWHHLSVGTVMHLEVIEDLVGSDPRPEVFDFSTGTGEHKKRFGTDSVTEFNALLIRRGFRGGCLAAAFRTSERFSDGAARFLDRLGIKSALKKWARRRATKNQNRS